MLHVVSKNLPGHNQAGVHKLLVYCIVMDSCPSTLLRAPAYSSFMIRWQSDA